MMCIFCGVFLEPLLYSFEDSISKCVVTCGTVSSVVTGGTVSKWGDMCGRM